jgi:hypothetical protein
LAGARRWQHVEITAQQLTTKRVGDGDDGQVEHAVPPVSASMRSLVSQSTLPVTPAIVATIARSRTIGAAVGRVPWFLLL